MEALKEIGIDAETTCRGSTRRRSSGPIAVSTCSEEVCPVTLGVRRISWVFADPKNLPLEGVREIRDEIRERVEELLAELDAKRT